MSRVSRQGPSSAVAFSSPAACKEEKEAHKRRGRGEVVGGRDRATKEMVPFSALARKLTSVLD